MKKVCDLIVALRNAEAEKEEPVEVVPEQKVRKHNKRRRIF
jgi:hypothetical protein